MTEEGYSPGDIAEAVVPCVLAVVSLIGNLLVVLAVIRNPAMQTNVNFLLVNLAIADVVAAVFVLPRFTFRFILTHPRGNAGDVLCKFVRDLSWVGGQASAFTLVAIAYERYFAILRPHRGLARTSKRKLNLIIVLSWIYGVALESPSIYSSKYNKDLRICDEKWGNVMVGRVYSVVLFIMDFVMPLAMMTVAYAGIVKHLWGRQSAGVLNAANLASCRFRKRVTLVLLAVTVSYTVCWLPLPLCYMLYHVTGPALVDYNSKTYNFAIMFVSLNACLDPILYSLQSKRFGRIIRRML
ncbi:predicted protein, partial [Nematostella vectensis]